MRNPWARSALAGLAGVAIISCGESPTNPSGSLRPARAASFAATPGTPRVVISQVYGGGGGTTGTPTYASDFVELFNAGSATATLDGWSVQYASAAGTGNFGASASALVALSGTLAPGQYYLIKLATGTVGGALPASDASGTIAMAAGAGKVALADQATTLGCNGSTTLCSSAQAAHIIDLVGYGAGSGGATYYEGSAAAPSLSTILSDVRADHGCTDTNSNSADFTAVTPSARNKATALAPCPVDGGGGGPVIGPLDHVVVSGVAPLTAGGTITLTAQLQDASNQNIDDQSATYAWQSSDASIASVLSTATNTATIKGNAAGGPVGIRVTATSNGVSKPATVNVTVSPGSVVLTPSNVTVSEIHYDNSGSDAGEAIEIEGNANTSLDGWSVVFYDGNGGTTYKTMALSGTIPAMCGTRGVLSFVNASNDIQNGSPDGWALVNAQGQPVEFKSYEGTFTATNGPVSGLTSTAIDADESTPPPVGQSVQRALNGVWYGPRVSSFGACNAATPPARQGSISITSGKPSLALGMQTQYFYSGTDAAGVPLTSVVWTTSDAAVITVDQSGVVTAKGVGAAKLTATSPDGTFGSVDMTVYIAAGSSSIRIGHNTEFGEPKDANPADDFIIRRAQYTVSYNPNRGGANWVSWNLDASHIGNNGRCSGTCYSADTVLSKAGLPAYTTADWVSGAQYDRGHMAPSADWTSSEADNNTTFFLSNFLPQRPDLNQGPWEVLESALRDSVSASNGSREAYIIAGGIFTNGTGLGTLLNLGKVWIPDSTWKIAVITPAGAGLNADGTLPAHTTVLAVNMPNVTGIRGVEWTTYITTVAKIEKSTGYNFLAMITESVQCRVEGRNCAPTARISGAGVSGGTEGQTLSFDASTSSDPDAGNTLSYMWSVDGQTVGIQPTLTHTFADNGTFSVRLIVSDQFGGADTTTTAVTVLNVAPSVAALPSVSISKGTAYTASGSFTDPGDDSWSATVDYGDGSGVQALALSGKTFSLNHVYGTPGTYTVKVTVRELDAEAASGSQTTTVTATNVAPVIGALSSATLLYGEAYMSSGTFSDSDPDTWTGTVNYGDGSGTAALQLLGKNFSLVHSYPAAGTFTVTVTISDGFDTATRTTTVTVRTAAQGIGQLGAQVSALTGLNNGQANSLQAKLDNAARMLEQGNTTAAVNMLGAFINDVQADVKSGRISTADGAAIVAYAERVIASIGAP